MLLFLAFFGASNWFRQVNLVTMHFDTGNMDQTLWQSLHGRWFQMSDPRNTGLISRSYYHADYLLLIYLPFYAVFSDPRTPLVLQVVAIASGAIPLFWLARKRLGAWVGAFFVVLYLLYPPLEWFTTYGVHAVVLTAPLFLWAWWAAVERKWWIYYPVIALTVMAKEQVGLVAATMGFYWVWRKGYRTMGLVTILFGLGWTLLMFGWAIPSARQSPDHFALSYYAKYGQTLPAVVLHLATHPVQTFFDLFGTDGLQLLHRLLWPVSYLSVIGLPVLLIALPSFAINILSNNIYQHRIFYQYMSVITPFIFLAAIDGWDRVRRWLTWWRPRWTRPLVGTLMSIGVAGYGLWAVWVWSPLPGMQYHQAAMSDFRPSPYRADVDAIQRMLLPTDRVATTNNIAPQFSRRALIWEFPKDLNNADAVIVLQGGNNQLYPVAEIDAAVNTLAENPNFKIVYHRDQIWYFRKAESATLVVPDIPQVPSS